VSLHLGSKVARTEGKKVLLKGGEQIDADIVVVGIGVEPRLELAEAARYGATIWVGTARQSG
jgi:NADPH-dependent 2,4-dienoyl-CoA reductase/sulfur reductase-like enzyme